MSFPYHDSNWAEVAEFLTPRVGPKDAILAPDDFWRLFPRIYRYINTRLKPDFGYAWAVIHKGQLGEFPPGFLRRLAAQMAPVFANAVFVVWGRARDGLPRSSLHVRPLLDAIPAGRWGEPTQSATDPVLPDPGSIFQFEPLNRHELRTAMDTYWRNGGYLYETQRDRIYTAEIDAYVSDYLGDVGDRAILDLCCGAGRLPPVVERARKIVAVDVSEVAVGFAAAAYRDKPEFEFHVMDAHALGFASESFDVVTFVEAMEHVHDAPAVFAEILRVLKPGGQVVLTTANTDSLHLMMTRKLGYPTFKTNYQHIREFSYAEACALLEQTGLKVTRSGGIFLYPYWGIPGVDQIVRSINDSDPEVVEVLRRLGRDGGPENAYAFIILAQKAA